jgi:hypothetical protein
MGCRCAERRVAIARAVQAAARGDRGAVIREIGFVGRSAAEDARALSARVVTQRLALLRGARR